MCTKYLYVHTKKNILLCTEVHIALYSYFPLSTETTFLDSKILNCIHCLQSHTACFPLVTGLVMATLEIHSPGEKCLTVSERSIEFLLTPTTITKHFSSFHSLHSTEEPTYNFKPFSRKTHREERRRGGTEKDYMEVFF